VAQRTNDDLVKAILRLGSQGGDYDDANNPSLARFIKVATLITDRVAKCAADKGFSLNSEELVEIETWLAAHYYTKSDRLYRSRTTASASGAFLFDDKNPEPYKAAAMEMDPSGCVAAVLSGRAVSVDWLGQTLGEQTDYDDRQ
jgi:hypothetical protein